MRGGVDEGWGGVNTDTRAGGNKDYGSSQIMPTNHGNVTVQTVASGSKGKQAESATRSYRSEALTQQSQRPAQTTLTELWSGNGGQTRSWSEDIAWCEQELIKDRIHRSLSYV